MFAYGKRPHPRPTTVDPYLAGARPQGGVAAHGSFITRALLPATGVSGGWDRGGGVVLSHAWRGLTGGSGGGERRV